MAVKLNNQAFEHAQSLVEQGKFVFDEKDMWSEHQPSAQDVHEYIREHGFGEYRKWYLGIDTEELEDDKKGYKVRYSGFERDHRCEELAAENREGQYKYSDIERAAADVHETMQGAPGNQR